MSKRGNQIRVVDPEQDRRLESIAKAVANAGYPESLASTLAEGFIARLRRRVYAALDDLIGDAGDVEALCGWKGPQCYLTEALWRAGYIRDVNGDFVMGDAVNEAPEYIKKRWQRANRAGYEEAVKRCGRPNVAHPRPTIQAGDDDYDYEGEMKKEAEMQNSQGSLFGIEPDQPGEVHAAKSGFTVFKEAYHRAYQSVYGHAYPWRPRDFKEIERILDALPADTDAAKLIAAYLACKDKFFAGHELRKLFADLARFTALARQHGGGAGGNAALKVAGNPDDAIIHRPRKTPRRGEERPQQ